MERMSKPIDLSFESAMVVIWLNKRWKIPSQEELIRKVLKLEEQNKKLKVEIKKLKEEKEELKKMIDWLLEQIAKLKGL